MIVTHLNEREWTKDDGTVVKVTDVTLDDGREIPGYDLPPGLEVGKPLPDGWEVALSKSGKPYVKVPKPGKGFGGGAQAYRNTKEGQFYEQERMDRRTAAMQATEGAVFDIAMANTIYDWLRKTSGSSSPPQGRAGTGDGSTTAAPSPRSSSATEGRGGKAQNHTPPAEGSASVPELELTGEGGTRSGAVCVHIDNSPLKPDGSALPNGFVRCLGCGVVHKGG